MTYSINNSTVIQTRNYDLSEISEREELLFTLKDNEDYLIQPKPLRNAILSVWSNNSFKETNVGNLTYIGIDTLNPDKLKRDAKYKIFMGKRSYSGTASYNTTDDILDGGLLNNDSDIFFYNTKDDLEEQITTKLTFLASTDTDLHKVAPYLSTQYVDDIDSLTFNIVNKGDINISSRNYTLINNISIPKSSESNTSDINNKILIHDGQRLKWDKFEINLDNLGATGSELNIYGDVNINDYDLDFTDSRKLPVDIGGLNQGESFGSNSISEILKRMIYPEQSPTGTLRLLPPYNNGVAEVGTFPNPVIEYTIVKKTFPTITTVLGNMNPSFYPPIDGVPYKTIIGNADAIVISPITETTQTYTITVSDSTQQQDTDQVFLKGVYPFFYGVDDTINITNVTNSSLSVLDKLLEDKTNKSLNFLGSGKLYFLYPKQYGELTSITDSNGNNLDYDKIDIIYSSPEGYWASKEYTLYYSVNTYDFEIPTKYNFYF